MYEGNSKISIIVPVYKVASYLDRCVESIVAQTYDHLEIILVDDGSPDCCPSMCDAWELKDKRIRVIHKENGGLSDARNAGVDASTGDYLLFVDSDDYIEATMCEKLMSAIERTQSDIAVGNFYWEYPDHKNVQRMSQSDGVVVCRERILEEYFLYGSVDMVVAWNKLYRRELFFTAEQIRYPVGRLHEDEYTSYRLLFAAKKTVFIDEPLYHYIQRDGSIMANFSDRNMQDIAGYAHSYLEWADKYAPEKRLLMEYAVVRICGILIWRCETMPQLNPYKSKVNKEIKHLIKQIRKFYMNPYAALKDKFRYSALRLGVLEPLYRFFRILRGCKHG